jgi:hypothetical protein
MEQDLSEPRQVTIHRELRDCEGGLGDVCEGFWANRSEMSRFVIEATGLSKNRNTQIGESLPSVL